MTATALTALPGFDVEKLEGFADYAEQNAEEVLLGLEAKTIWEGRAGHSLAKIGPWALAGERIEKPSRDFSIQFGAWKEVEEAIGIEGASDKIEPVEAALAAISSCVTWAICINAARQGVSFDALQVSARTKVDPRVLLGILPEDEAQSCLSEVELTVDVQGDLDETDREAIARMVNRSPVHAMIKHANAVRTQVNLG